MGSINISLFSDSILSANVLFVSDRASNQESGVIHTAFVERMKRTVQFQQDVETGDMELWVQNKRIPKLDGSRIIYTTRRKKTSSKKGKKGRKTAAPSVPSLPPLAIMETMPASSLGQVYCIRSTGPPNRRPLRDLALPVKGKQNGSKATLDSPDVCPLCFTVKNIKEIRKEQQLKHQDLLDKQNSKRSNRVKKKTPASQKVSSLLIGVMGIFFACG